MITYSGFAYEVNALCIIKNKSQGQSTYILFYIIYNVFNSIKFTILISEIDKLKYCKVAVYVLINYCIFISIAKIICKRESKKSKT